MQWTWFKRWAGVCAVWAFGCGMGHTQIQEGLQEATLRAKPFSPHYVQIGNTVFVSGPYENWYMRIQQGLQAGATRVVFVNANSRRHDKLGGASYVAGQLRRKEITTVVIGRCDTFCSIAFMGGVERLFGQDLPGEKTRLDVRGFMDYDTRKLETRFPESEFAPLVKMEPRFNENKALWLDAFGKVTDPSGSLLVDADSASFCASRTAQKGCKTHEGVNAASLGVVTTDQRVALTLPTMFPAPEIVGEVNGADINALPVKDDFMRSTLRDFLQMRVPRALVVPSIAKPSTSGSYSATGLPDVAAIALMKCYEETGAICRLYAMDSDVLRQPAP
ncbi:MAG: hypothetical protein V4627_00410 [Pseudomonadota bacterium]